MGKRNTNTKEVMNMGTPMGFKRISICHNERNSIRIALHFPNITDDRFQRDEVILDMADNGIDISKTIRNGAEHIGTIDESFNFNVD